jgi:predicted DNA-binding protein with PD1-like motif
MKAAMLHEHQGLRSFAVILGSGDAAMASLAAFASEQRLGSAHFTAIGAFSRLVVAYFDWNTRKYEHRSIEEQVEVLSLVGDITLEGDTPKVHAHIVVGKRDATAHGGHFIEGDVRPTLEIVLTELPRHLRRRFDPESGLTLIDPSST